MLSNDYCFATSETEADPNGRACNVFAIGSPNGASDLELRFAAPEELSVQKSVVKEFSAQQMRAVSDRLGAIRAASPSGGGAAADDASAGAGRLSGFVTLSRGFGSRDQTAWEDEVDFTGNEAVVGLDYRVNSSTVAGVALGYIDRDIGLKAEFSDPGLGIDPTSNADGRHKASGGGLTIYGQWESGRAFVSGSIGHQWLSHDMRREADYYHYSITQPVQFTARGSTDSSNLQAGLGGGYLWSAGAFGFEATANGLYQRTRLKGFEESGAEGIVCINYAGPPCEDTLVNMNMRFASQLIKSFEATATLSARYTANVGSVVMIPFLDGDVIRQLEGGRHAVKTMFSALYGDPDNDGNIDFDYFSLDTDKADRQYFALSTGFSIIGRGGWQGFLRYRRTLGLRHVADNVITAGLRHEF